jgi:hypothetical protein
MLNYTIVLNAQRIRETGEMIIQEVTGCKWLNSPPVVGQFISLLCSDYENGVVKRHGHIKAITGVNT